MTKTHRGIVRHKQWRVIEMPKKRPFVLFVKIAFAGRLHNKALAVLLQYSYCLGVRDSRIALCVQHALHVRLLVASVAILYQCQHYVTHDTLGQLQTRGGEKYANFIEVFWLSL